MEVLEQIGRKLDNGRQIDVIYLDRSRLWLEKVIGVLCGELDQGAD